MSDAFTTITTFINSPPVQLAAGASLGGIVYTFFKIVGDVLHPDTNLEIAVWLMGVEVEQKVEPWPSTFARVFDRVFGEKHLSLKCFYRSTIASLLSVALALLVVFSIKPGLLMRYWDIFHLHPTVWIICIVLANILPDYFSLLESRFVLSKMQAAFGSGRRTFVGEMLLWIGIDFSLTFFLASVARLSANRLVRLIYTSVPLLVWIESALTGKDVRTLEFLSNQVDWFQQLILTSALTGLNDGYWLWVYPAFFTSIWLWLYAGSGFLLKFARHLDIGFQWFNRKFDIEKKPLQAIGLVAGALVAVIYWTAAIVVRVL